VAGKCLLCSYQLYAKPLPRHIGFHDLQHATATLPLKEGVPLAVRKVLRHSDPKLTSEIYGHLELADVRRGMERLNFGPAVLPVSSETDAQRRLTIAALVSGSYALNLDDTGPRLDSGF